MAKEQVKDRLGRGLAALLGDEFTDEEVTQHAHGVRNMPIEFIRSNSLNPRKQFPAEDLAELAHSIKEKGLLQPVVVRRVAGSEDDFEIIAGERRWRAAQQAGLHEIPIVQKDVTDGEALEIAIIENVQRSDLNPLEEAEGYKRLMEEFDYTQEQLSATIGKSRSHLANMLRLLKLPEKVQAYVNDGLLTAGHARALVSAEQPEELALNIVQGGLSVRQAEDLVKTPAKKTKTGDTAPSEKDADTRALEQDLSRALGLKVAIKHHGKKGGEVKISYKKLEQLDEICRRLTTLPDSDAF